MSLQQAMSRGDLATEEFVQLSKDYAAIEPVAAAAREVRRLRAELEVLNGMVADPTAEPELKEMAAARPTKSATSLPLAERALALKLLPRDAADDRAAMLEVRAGHRRRRGGAVRRRSAAHVPALRRDPGLAVRADLGERSPSSAATRKRSPRSTARACSPG